MTLPAIASIRQGFPNAEITVLAKEWVAEIFVLSPDVDKIIIFDDNGRHKGVCGKIRLANEIRTYDFDMAILLQNAISAAIITAFAGIPKRVGYNTDARSFLLTNAIKLRKETKKLHQTKYYLEMVKELGCPNIYNDVFLKVPHEYLLIASQLLENNSISNGDMIIGMAPGAAYGPAKRWLTDRFTKLADMLADELNAKILLFGSKQDLQMTQEIATSSGHKIVDFAGKTTLKEAIALINACHLFISNDSGLMHVAGALDKPTVAIFGSTNHITTSPIGSRCKIVRKDISCAPCLKKVCDSDFRCMTSISVEDVFIVAKELMENG